MACSFKTYRHALGLLKNLNSQRQSGHFCDCVIRLHLFPEKLYLAHRNILAASSPVLASLLSNQGALLDLQHPNLTPETLGLLLNFIYTGNLPPPGSEDSVCCAATYLEMEELRQALGYRHSVIPKSPKDIDAGEIISDVKTQPDLQSTKKNVNNLTLYQGPGWSRVSPPSCESVPVIRHASIMPKDEKKPLCSKVYPQCVSLCQGQEADCPLGIPQSGMTSQYYGQPASPGSNLVTQGSDLVRYSPVITGAKNDKSLDIVTETQHHLCITAREDEKPALKGDCRNTAYSCPESSGEDCNQMHVVKCAKKTYAVPDPWANMTHCSTENCSVSPKITIGTPAVKRLDIQKDNDPVRADTDNEKEQYLFHCQKNEFPAFRGEVTYSSLKMVQLSDSDGEPSATEAGAAINVGDSSVNVNANCPASNMVNMPSTQLTVGLGSSGVTVEVLDDLAAAAQPYRCVKCERAFSQRGSLNRHLRSHLGVRPYPCPRCPMTFSRQYRVMEHLKVHQRDFKGLRKTVPT